MFQRSMRVLPQNEWVLPEHERVLHQDLQVLPRWSGVLHGDGRWVQVRIGGEEGVQ